MQLVAFRIAYVIHWQDPRDNWKRKNSSHGIIVIAAGIHGSRFHVVDRCFLSRRGRTHATRDGIKEISWSQWRSRKGCLERYLPQEMERLAQIPMGKTSKGPTATPYQILEAEISMGREGLLAEIFNMGRSRHKRVVLQLQAACRG